MATGLENQAGWLDSQVKNMIDFVLRVHLFRYSTGPSTVQVSGIMQVKSLDTRVHSHTKTYIIPVLK